MIVTDCDICENCGLENKADDFHLCQNCINEIFEDD